MSAVFSYIKWSKKSMINDIEYYHKMWIEALNSIDELNKEVIKAKEETMNVQDENIKLKTQNNRLKEKNSELIAELEDYEKEQKDE